MQKWKPQNDGVDHINVYSKGKTELGRALSNFAATPFHLDGVRFVSVESYWYYMILRNYPDKQKEVATLVGWKAKSYGRESVAFPAEPPTKQQLLNAYMAKVQENRWIEPLLLANKLPFAHYYVYGGTVRYANNWLWTAELWEQVAIQLERK